MVGCVTADAEKTTSTQAQNADGVSEEATKAPEGDTESDGSGAAGSAQTENAQTGEPDGAETGAETDNALESVSSNENEAAQGSEGVDPAVLHNLCGQIVVNSSHQLHRTASYTG